jgi:hypothetical protein
MYWCLSHEKERTSWLEESLLSRRDQVLWVVSILLAIVLCISGMHAKNAAEMRRSEAGLYRLMPGIVLGLIAGLVFDNSTVVLLVAIAANAVVYHFLIKGVIRLYATAKNSMKFHAKAD